MSGYQTFLAVRVLAISCLYIAVFIVVQIISAYASDDPSAWAVFGFLPLMLPLLFIYAVIAVAPAVVVSDIMLDWKVK